MTAPPSASTQKKQPPATMEDLVSHTVKRQPGAGLQAVIQM